MKTLRCNSSLKSKLMGLLTVGALSLTFVIFAESEAQNQWKKNPPKLRLSDPLPSNLFVELARVINPAVVNISTTQLPRARSQGPFGGRDPMLDFLERFMGGGHPLLQPRPSQSMGTGFVIREDGLIITNNHVIDNADIIKVQLSEKDKEQIEAEVIGGDKKTDIAVIKIKVKNKLPTVTLGKSGELQVGEWVAAFGNPYGHGHTVTKGIVSAIGREIDEINLLPFIQTDASINPGNSGGPLVNSRGEVIGVNTAIDARAQNIGFAIPIDYVKDIVPQLESKGRVDRGFLGINMQDLDEESAKALGLKQSEGALVLEVVPESAAEKAGIQPYDLIFEINGKKVKNSSALASEVGRSTAGQKVSVKALRDGKEKSFKVTLGEFKDPEEQPVARSGPTRGQKAPFNLGFEVADYSSSLAKELGIPLLKRPYPIVVSIQRGSKAARAGIAVGDVILDVNRRAVGSAKDVLKGLQKGRTNTMRILRQDRPLIVYLEG